ncbi:MAG: efflux RND transporter periplasmic adaptor subunit [Acidobacteriota bacterium]
MTEDDGSKPARSEATTSSPRDAAIPSRGSRKLAIAIVVAAAGAAVAFHAPLIAWFTGAPAGGAAGNAVTVTAGTWRVATALDPDPPRERGQRVRVTVGDAAGAPVHGDVEVTYDMPAMGAMPEMKSSFPARMVEHGSYDATVDFPMGGTWGLWVKVSAGGACAIVRYKLTIGQPGLTPDGTGSCVATADTTIQIDETRQRELGITTAKVTRAPMTLQIRAVGKLTYDESRLTDVVLKVGGYVSNLRVRATGQPVKKGEALFSLYSPELFAAEQDYLVARNSQGIVQKSEGLLRAAEQKLELLGLTPAQVQQIAGKGEAIEKLVFTAPASGSVIEKNVIDGDAVQAGQRLFRIAALDKVWVEADLFEADLGKVSVGMPASVVMSSGPALAGKVTFVYPYLDPQTRTGRVRIELPNHGLELKPDMYATVTFDVALPEQLQVPTSAIVYTGPRRLVYVELGGGKIEPREVELGAEAGDRTAITKGLADGDVVVTSGNFLVAAESRLRGGQ